MIETLLNMRGIDRVHFIGFEAGVVGRRLIALDDVLSYRRHLPRLLSVICTYDTW